MALKIMVLSSNSKVDPHELTENNNEFLYDWEAVGINKWRDGTLPEGAERELTVFIDLTNIQLPERRT